MTEPDAMARLRAEMERPPYHAVLRPQPVSVDAQSGTVTIRLPYREEFRRAAELAGDDALKLRAGDALHLAIAGSLNAQGILCLDEAMIESAKALGVGVVAI